MSKVVDLNSLTNSIENFTSNKVSFDKDYFYYKSIDFRFAFERSIYFQIRNSNKIFDSLENSGLNNLTIFIGYDPKEDICAKILAHTIRSFDTKIKYKIIKYIGYQQCNNQAP